MAAVRAPAGTEAAARAARRPPARRLDATRLPARARARVEIHLPRYQPRSTLILAACLWAGDEGRLRPFKHALYEAFFCEGEDIATDGEIRRAASRADLDPDGAIAAAYSPERIEQLADVRREAEEAGAAASPRS